MTLLLPPPIPWSCYLRAEALFDRQMGHGLAVRCEVLGLCSLPGRPLQVHVRLENGALWWRVPIRHLVHGAEPVNTAPQDEAAYGGLAVYRTEVPAIPLHDLQLWDCFDGPMEAAEIPGLAGRMMAYRRGKEWIRGRYLFTVDWAYDEYGASGHKCGHVIECEDGTYAVQPNNRVCSYDPATVEPFCETGKVPRFRVRTYNDSCELRRDGTGEGYHYEVEMPSVGPDDYMFLTGDGKAMCSDGVRRVVHTTMPGWSGIAHLGDGPVDKSYTLPKDLRLRVVEPPDSTTYTAEQVDQARHEVEEVVEDMGRKASDTIGRVVFGSQASTAEAMPHRLPTLPATCGECEYSGLPGIDCAALCQHPSRWGAFVAADRPPPKECPLRKEAK